MVGAVHGEGDGVVVYHHMRLAVGLGDPTAGANTVREEIENQFLFEEQGEGDHTDYVWSSRSDATFVWEGVENAL